MGYLAKFTFLSAALCVTGVASATAATLNDVPRTDKSIRIDGVMDDDAWLDAVQISLNFETDPGENTPAKVDTIAFLIEDGNSLFVAFKAADPDPAAIRAYLRDRDSAWNDDFVGIVLDTFNDGQRAFEFFANPYGVQMDRTNDDVNKNENPSWNAIWSSVGQINANGYTVEMEIPLSQLRFPQADGKQTWGIDLIRSYPREHQFQLANNPRDRNVNCYLCQFGKIEGFEGAEPSKDLEIVPSLTASKVDTTDDPGNVPLGDSDPDAEVGLNLRWGITPDMTINLAINPDFSQIEADIPQIAVNNQFALFFPETRPFFLEGADYFTTPIDAVFTRTVADPSFGAKLTGKRGKNTFGFFATQDEITNLLFPGPFGSDSTTLAQDNSALVARYSRGFGESSTVGALFTGRTGDNYHNTVGGLDMRWRINDQHNLELQYLRSETEYPIDVALEFEQPLGRFDGDAGTARYEYDSRNWFAFVQHEQHSPGFRADSGFVPRVDTNRQKVGLRRSWFGEEEDWFTRIRLSGDWEIIHDEQGRMLEREVEAKFRVGLPLQIWTMIGIESRDALFDDILFHEEKISFYGQSRPISGLEFGLYVQVGDQIDFANSRLGDQLYVEPFVNWNANKNLLLRFQGTLSRLDSKDGPNIFNAQLYDIRLTWQFNVRSYIRFTTQYQIIDRNPDEYIDPVESETRDVGRQLLYSYKLNPQTVFFLGYSDQLIKEDYLENLTTTDRTWFMKVSYAWTP
jgi:hypothetical protein